MKFVRILWNSFYTYNRKYVWFIYTYFSADSIDRKMACYNCGSSKHISSSCDKPQQYSLCPSCRNVAKTAEAHKSWCTQKVFVSTFIGSTVLEVKDCLPNKFGWRPRCVDSRWPARSAYFEHTIVDCSTRSACANGSRRYIAICRIAFDRSIADDCQQRWQASAFNWNWWCQLESERTLSNVQKRIYFL